LFLCRTALWTAWDEPVAARAALEPAPYLVILDSERREMLEYASALLPIGTHAECDGTFTNHARRVQRFHRAAALPGDARAGWSVLSDLLSRVSGEPPFTAPADVFGALALETAAFRDQSYARLRSRGLPR